MSLLKSIFQALFPTPEQRLETKKKREKKYELMRVKSFQSLEKNIQILIDRAKNGNVKCDNEGNMSLEVRSTFPEDWIYSNKANTLVRKLSQQNDIDITLCRWRTGIEDCSTYIKISLRE